MLYIITLHHHTNNNPILQFPKCWGTCTALTARTEEQRIDNKINPRHKNDRIFIKNAYNLFYEDSVKEQKLKCSIDEFQGLDRQAFHTLINEKYVMK